MTLYFIQYSTISEFFLGVFKILIFYCYQFYIDENRLPLRNFLCFGSRRILRKSNLQNQLYGAASCTFVIHTTLVSRRALSRWKLIYSLKNLILSDDLIHQVHPTVQNNTLPLQSYPLDAGSRPFSIQTIIKAIAFPANTIPSTLSMISCHCSFRTFLQLSSKHDVQPRLNLPAHFPRIDSGHTNQLQ